jgi:hypothetical protein
MWPNHILCKRISRKVRQIEKLGQGRDIVKELGRDYRWGGYALDLAVLIQAGVIFAAKFLAFL